MKKALITILAVLIADQSLKIWVKTHMTYTQALPVFGNWFNLQFIENPGMAFGMEFGGEYGKLALSIFRVLAVVGLTYGLWTLVKKKAPGGFIIALSLIIAGAFGNIIDSAFYGIIFSDSTYTDVAVAFPEGGGYAGFLHGHVVDMLHFPLFEGYFPDWFPFWGGESFEFFRPVFNLADSSISAGVALIILRQKKYFAVTAKANEVVESEIAEVAPGVENLVESQEAANPKSEEPQIKDGVNPA